jgi:hypothetical protein
MLTVSRDEQFARELQRESSAAFYPATQSSSSSSQALYDSKTGSFTSKKTDIGGLEETRSQPRSSTGRSSLDSSHMNVSGAQHIRKDFGTFPTLPRDRIDFSNTSSSAPFSSSVSQVKPEPQAGRVKSERGVFQIGQGSRSRPNGFQVPSNVDVVDLSEDLPRPRASTSLANQFLGHLESENPASYSALNDQRMNPYTVNADSSEIYGPGSSLTETQPKDTKLFPHHPGNSPQYFSPISASTWGRNDGVDTQSPGAMASSYRNEIAQPLGIMPYGSVYGTVQSPSGGVPYGSVYGSVQPLGNIPYGSAYRLAQSNSIVHEQAIPGAYPTSPYTSTASTAKPFSSSQKPQPSRNFRDTSRELDDDGQADFIHQSSSLASHSAYYDYITNDPTKSKAEIQELLDNIGGDGEIPPENREGTPDAMVRLAISAFKFNVNRHRLILSWSIKRSDWHG